MTAEEIRGLAAELGLAAIGVSRAEAYVETERHIVERRARGLFADMKFTMAQPERSCHPESLLPGARSVVSVALCYWEPEAPLAHGEGRLARYTWSDAYDELREQLAVLGRAIGGNSFGFSSTRISMSTARQPLGAESGSTARTRC